MSSSARRAPVRGGALLAGAALAAAAAPGGAQSPYREPPPAIARILDAAPLPAVSPSPDRRWLLQLRRPGLPPIAEVAAPEVRLAGLRLDPRTNGGSRDATYAALAVQPTDGRDTARVIALPADAPRGARLGFPLWSPDGRHVAFTVTAPEAPALALYVADVAAARARRLARVPLVAVAGAPCAWRTAEALLCRTVPAGRGAPPAAPAAPAGPIVQESEGRAAPNRTYQDLLASPHDERLFDHYATSQLAELALDGRVRPVGRPAVYVRALPSPDGRWVWTEAVHRPYSYVVPLSRFPLRMAVLDAATGREARVLHDRGPADDLSTSFDAVVPGPRGVTWRADRPATLAWAQALDDGDPARPAERRDRLHSLEAPFGTDPVAHGDFAGRVQGVTWARGDLAVVEEGWNRTRRARSWIIAPDQPERAPRPLFDRSSEDRYADPGELTTTAGPFGRPVLQLTPDGRAFLIGAGASREGDRPFLDRLDLATGTTERLFRSQAPHHEEVVAVVDARGERIVTRRQGVSEVPNYWLRDLVRRIAPRPLTRFADPAPQFAGVTRQLVTYRRADGVQLSATLYLPAGYDRGRDGPLPFLLWAYPQEFRSRDAAAQVVGSPYLFTRPAGASHLFLLTQGYGVLDGPTMPIVGEGTAEPNDTYVEQLVASARAAVDTIVAMGVADRERIAVGGHSYGAFMTANLLAHSRLFRAGIARSGAYNRTLTPFGFQGEERPYWQARALYERMSPFTYADSVRAPLLLIHGMADDNSGTFPVQSERFYQALRGHGATVRYVQLPAEAHGYRARESVGHTLWEMAAWLDRWVKPKPGGRPTAAR